MSEPSKAVKIRCMFDADRAAAGGTANVHFLADANAEDLSLAADAFFASHKNAGLNTEQVFVGGSAGKYVNESYSAAGTRIRFCGHGAVAAAWLVFELHERDASLLEFASAERDWSARRSTDAEMDVVLSFAKPEPVSARVPEFAREALGFEPVHAAKVGGDEDYLILELADSEDVRSLQPDHAAISAATRRALIVTAQNRQETEPGCVFRYFAPQYGSPEDAATGSAAVQLAAFWADRFGVQWFSAAQLSEAGAYLRLGCNGDTVDLAARVGYR